MFKDKTKIMFFRIGPLRSRHVSVGYVADSERL